MAADEFLKNCGKDEAFKGVVFSMVRILIMTTGMIYKLEQLQEDHVHFQKQLSPHCDFRDIFVVKSAVSTEVVLIDAELTYFKY